MNVDEIIGVLTFKSDTSLKRKDLLMYEKAVDEAKQQLKQLILSALPEKVKSDSPEILREGWIDAEYIAYNRAIDKAAEALTALFEGEGEV